ncbi:SpoIIE family protein phosphatase [Streptomyces sp. V4-01]|uniref:SpoIIE family protein phosphatase n=1 Tax=Actinacidiphila polyblastidii TaxID=3110430 RepID=A0ABU7PJS6_9ACTN|nr:SpoIIE family protein phosphatase [Streptomyces sp. V4-01]
MAEVRLVDTEFLLAPGDLLLLYTDGAIESRAKMTTTPQQVRPMFGEADLTEALAACGGLDAAATVARLSTVLATHNHGWASDDTALLALRVPDTR